MRRTRWTVRLLALALAALTCGPLAARAAFDDIEVSPESRAAGWAWTAVLADPYAPFHNPASLGWAGRVNAAGSWVRPFGYDFASQMAACGTVPLPRRLGAVALGVRHFGVEYLGENLLGETTYSASHGFLLLDDAQTQVAFGYTLSLYSLDFGTSVTGLDPGSATSVGVNVGVTATVRERTRVGFQALNLNNPSIGKRDHEDLRRGVAIGVSYAPYAGVETMLDIENTLGEDVRYRGGVAFEVAEYLTARAGLLTAPNQFTAGLGFKVAGMKLDYGYSTGGVLPDTHHIGVGYLLPAQR